MRATTAAARAGSSDGDARGDAGGDAGERRLQHEGEGGQAAGHHPHDGGEPTDRDAEQQGAVGVLGGRPHRDADVGAEEEPGQPGQDWRDDEHDEDLVADERLDAEVEVEAERDLEAAGEGDESSGPCW